VYFLGSERLSCGKLPKYSNCQIWISQQTSDYSKATMSNAGPSGRMPGEGFVRSSLGFRCSKSILHTDNLSLFW